MKYLFSLLIVISSGAWAADMLTAQELRSQVVLHVQSFITSADGKQIQEIGSSQSKYSLQAKRGDISGMWIENPKGFSPVRLEFTFRVNEDRSMTLNVTQYASIRLDVKTGAIVQKEGKGKSEIFELKDFSSVTWVSETMPTGRVVIRFTP